MRAQNSLQFKFQMMVNLSLLLFTMIFLGVSFSSSLREEHSILQMIFYTLVFVALLFLLVVWILCLISTHRRFHSRFLARFIKWMLCNVYFYLARMMAFITFQKRSEVQESFLHFNNSVVLSQVQANHIDKILLLLPHCLQDSECRIRITTDINTCASCGNCSISELKALAKKYNLNAAVATGGSLARKIIKDTIPDVIIAVACHRDLTEGVRDAWSYPTYAVLNERPNGPCFNTTVSLDSIEYAIRKFRV
nr:uncharacterized protein [Candidatus Cloacimonadota bacterium]